MKRTDSEKELIELFITGDPHAMKRLYEVWAPYLSAVCMRYVPDPDIRKDILQEALIKIYSKISDFEWRGPGSLKSWMARIVANEALQYLRKERNNNFEERNLDNQETIPASDTPDPSSQEDDSLEDIPLQTLLEMISELPEGYRAVFNLFVFEGLSHKDIAKMLGIKENSSASQFHRAKQLLAERITAWRNRHA